MPNRGMGREMGKDDDDKPQDVNVQEIATDLSGYYSERGHFEGIGLPYPPDHGPLAAVTPGTPGGLMVMLAEYGRLSLAEVLAPAMQLAEGYPIEELSVMEMEGNREVISRWPGSERLFLPHLDENDPEKWAAPRPGEIFRQPDLLATLQKLVDTEVQALAERHTDHKLRRLSGAAKRVVGIGHTLRRGRRPGGASQPAQKPAPPSPLKKSAP